MARIVAVGDNVVDCYKDLRMMFPGGNCVNVAVNARRLGHEAAYLGVIGSDELGRLIDDSLSREGVETGRMRRISGTSSYCMISHENGDRKFLGFDIGVSFFAPTADELAYIGGYDAAHVGQSSGLDPYLSQIAGRTRLSYDFSYRHDIHHRRSVGPLCYLATASAADMAEHEVVAMAQDILGTGCAWVLMTRGSKGASLFSRSTRHDVEARPTTIVDTLGAGDAFAAATLCGLLDGGSPEDVLDRAAGASATACASQGGFGHGAALAAHLSMTVESGPRIFA